MPRSRVDLERPSERPEHVDRVARPEAGEPLRATANRPEVDRDDACRDVRRVDGERPTQHEPGVVAGPDVNELPGPGAAREPRRVERLEPLPRKDLSAIDELRSDEAHRHARGASSGSSSSSSSPSSSSASAVASAAPAAPAASAPSPAAAVAASSGAIEGYASASASARSPKTSVGS